MEFMLTTVETVERAYLVTAETEAGARARLRLFFKDADMLREGIITPQVKETVKGRRIVGARKPGAQAPTGAASPPKGTTQS